MLATRTQGVPGISAKSSGRVIPSRNADSPLSATLAQAATDAFSINSDFFMATRPRKSYFCIDRYKIHTWTRQRNDEGHMASRGRLREFDRELALRKAMNVFWALGYEGASHAKLMQAMANINAPSFYAAFGSKELLFREAVELYQRTEGSGTARALREQPTAKAAIEAMLRDAV